MRYDTPIYFQHYPKPNYDANTGDYMTSEPLEVKCLANVTDARTQSIALELGKIKEGSLIIRLQNSYPSAFDSIRIGKKRYKIEAIRSLRSKQTILVNEV